MDGLTSHEIRDIDGITSFLGILVCEKSTIWKFPAKDVGDKYNYSFLRCPFIWPSHIGWKTLIGDLGASWLARMNRSAHTVPTLNGIHDDRISRSLLLSMLKKKISSLGGVDGNNDF